MNETRWLIWSIEKNRWWKPGRFGYTAERAEAGRYTFEEAIQIVNDANAYLFDDQSPKEAMIMDTYGDSDAG